MLRPERIWVVGDKTFSTYEEARTYIASRRDELQREALTAEIHKALISDSQISLASTENVAIAIAERIAKQFKFTLRK
jgi:hypothetical protein